jgi:NADPH2:quinone reductase
MRAVRITRTGGPEVLELADLPPPAPGPGQALVRHKAIGLNFIDTYQRAGLYPLTLPAILGNEASGVVEAVGDGVEAVEVGDRVAYASIPGAYAEASVVKADRLVKLPDSISFETAAALMLKGLTSEFLLRIWPLAKGDTVLVHAAAGGVGSILTQWLHHLGVGVIGVVGTEAKAELARGQGCTDTIVHGDGVDVARRVRALTGGDGVKVVYDSVGKATFQASLKSLARRGLLVSFGNASGPVPPVAPLELSRNGSLFLTRPTLGDYIKTRAELETAAAALFEAIASGAVKVEIGQTWPLAEVRAAHEALEGRRTTGATVLIP